MLSGTVKDLHTSARAPGPLGAPPGQTRRRGKQVLARVSVPARIGLPHLSRPTAAAAPASRTCSYESCGARWIPGSIRKPVTTPTCRDVARVGSDTGVLPILGGLRLRDRVACLSVALIMPVRTWVLGRGTWGEGPLRRIGRRHREYSFHMGILPKPDS